MDTKELLKRGERDFCRSNLRGADLSWADLRWANLHEADLCGANLRWADLSGASLRWADLRWANLSRANLRGADLSGADLRGADLRGANLRGATLNWLSHDLLAEILRGETGYDVEKRKIAGLILISRDWCWNDFLTLDDPLKGWALDTLAQYVQPDDGAPEALRIRAEKLKGPEP